MAFNSQIFKAPSLTKRPKLGKTTVSSSVFSGASSNVSIKKISFGGLAKAIGSQPDIAKIDKITPPEANPLADIVSDLQSQFVGLQANLTAHKKLTAKGLTETNRILVEIQKQLAFDFAMRIAEEKADIKKIKTAESKKEIAAEEGRLEGGAKKIGGVISKTFQKVTSPVKGLFDRIKEFFGLILAGIVLNAGFKWLQDENNRTLLSNVFGWITKAFIPLLLGVLGWKLIKWSVRLYRFGKWLWKVPGRLWRGLSWIWKLPGRLGKGASKGAQAAAKGSEVLASKLGSGSAKALSKGVKPVVGKLTQRGLVKTGQRGATEIFKMGNKASPFTSTIARAPGLPPKATSKVAQKVGMKLGGKSVLKAIPILGSIISIAEGIYRLSQGDMTGGILSFGTAIPMAGGLFLVADIIRALMGDDNFDSKLGINKGGESKGPGMPGGNFLGGPLPEISTKQNKGETSAEYNEGGTVYGKGSGLVDSVRAMLAPGEEVIRTTSAMLFRPLLKDINDNAGRLWQTFNNAIKKIISVTSEQIFVTEEFGKIIEDFDQYIKDEITKRRQEQEPPAGGGLNGRPSPPHSPPTLKPLKKKTNKSSSGGGGLKGVSTTYNLQKSNSSGINLINLPLPDIVNQASPPVIKEKQISAEEQVPFISSTDSSNSWMQITLSEFYIPEMAV